MKKNRLYTAKKRLEDYLAKRIDKIEELAYKHGLGYYDMFNVHLDRETVIKIPQISRDELNSPDTRKNKGFFSKLFGR